MLFDYKVVSKEGKEEKGQIDAVNRDLAISSLQQRGYIVSEVHDADEPTGLQRSIPFFDKVSTKDLVMMSRQLATLFEAQVSAVKAFSLLADSADNHILRKTLSSVAQDIKGGVSISQSMNQYPEVFSDFYVNMVKSGEESGKLTDTFLYLADYIERSYEMISKTRNALVYPVFVIFTFIVVIVLMLTMVIPRLSEILLETGQDIPFYTKAVIALSNLFTGATGFVLLAIAVIGIGVLVYSSQTKSGQKRLDALKLQIPYISNLYNKLYLSRIADNMNTMLSAGIPVVRALEITRDVVDNKVYSDILDDAVEAVRGGSAISTAFAEHEQMPPIMVQMVKVGEETGSLGEILKTLARFYKREVDSAIDTLIGLIEPVLIIVLAIAVGFLITSILLPIYNIAGSL